MKTEDTNLQPSKELASFFADRREEAPLLATTQVEKLLAERAMLPTSNNHTLRRLIMTISGLAGIAALTYLLWPGQPTTAPNRTDAVNITESVKSDKTIQATPTSTQEKVEKRTTEAQFSKPLNSAGNQVYANLTPAELAKIGIVVSGDTVYNYMVDEHDTLKGKHDSIERGAFGAKFISTGDRVKTLPSYVSAPHFYPVLMTLRNGKGAAWRERGNVGWIGSSGFEAEFREWLQKPATIGYIAHGFTKTFSFPDSNGNPHAKTVLEIGKDFPAPSRIPFSQPKIKGYPDSVISALVQLAHYYEGSIPNPNITLPKSLILKVDTITPMELLHQMDSFENTATMLNVKSILSHLNNLVGVPVHRQGFSDDSDYILWYKPTEELLNALPPKQSQIFRNKKAPQCMSAPAAVTSSAEVTYCIEAPQEVLVQVIDLTGHVVMTLHQHAESGDNIAKVNTESLSSGMYIISVQNNDGSQRTRRIWVQNAHPKQ